jgi:hypothetical protein
VNDPQCANLADEQYSVYQSWLAQKNGTAQNEFTIQQASPPQVKISVCTTGDWSFLYAQNVIRAFIGSGTVNEGDKSKDPQIECQYLPSCLPACYTKVFTMQELQPPVDRVIAFKNKNLFALGGLNVEISPIVELRDLDPTAVVADGDGYVALCGLNTNPIHIFASDPQGRYEYDCSINLSSSACLAVVPDGVTNTPGACNQTLTPPSCAVQ